MLRHLKFNKMTVPGSCNQAPIGFLDTFLTMEICPIIREAAMISKLSHFCGELRNSYKVMETTFI